ncbi:hypothetical protein MCBMB27_02752 [Methylobacterium phyllosphaerae]|uniref:Uncharacterized protein n=1 Tax=Methylobacterium phyllosphaerae TaxID=418223 RepID=A0ABM6G399_9HYPH|nr:hypothetical protein MCBMB27_02752 [Methylobacterium phyllosphaerae]
MTRSLPLRRDQSYDLTASRDEISQRLSLGIGPGANGRIGGRREPGDHGVVDAVGFGTLAQRASEGTDLCWVHDHGWQPPGGERTCHHGFQTAGRLKDDELRLQEPEAFAQLLHALGRTINGEVCPCGMNVNIEAVTSHVDPDNRSAHLIPSLRNRA